VGSGPWLALLRPLAGLPPLLRDGTSDTGGGTLAATGGGACTGGGVGGRDTGFSGPEIGGETAGACGDCDGGEEEPSFTGPPAPPAPLPGESPLPASTGAVGGATTWAVTVGAAPSGLGAPEPPDRLPGAPASWRCVAPAPLLATRGVGVAAGRTTIAPPIPSRRSGACGTGLPATSGQFTCRTIAIIAKPTKADAPSRAKVVLRARSSRLSPRMLDLTFRGSSCRSLWLTKLNHCASKPRAIGPAAGKPNFDLAIRRGSVASPTHSRVRERHRDSRR
jgi:hypothetical protein